MVLKLEIYQQIPEKNITNLKRIRHSVITIIDIITGIIPNSIKSLASTCLRNLSFSSLSSSTDEEAL